MAENKKLIRRKIQNLQTKDIRYRSPRSRYLHSIREAKKRCVKFALSYETYSLLVMKPCTYCGLKKHEQGIGLDRLNNQLGYIPFNVVPACHICNVMRNSLPVWLFLRYVKRIADQLK